MQSKLIAGAVLSAAVLLAPLDAQTKKTTYISNDEVQAYLKRAETGSLNDLQVRAVGLEKGNVGIAVVYRGKLTAPAKQSVAEHNQVNEVYHIIDGSATLVTGAEIVDLKPRPADDRAVRLLTGPGGNGASLRNGVTQQVKAGDIVVIPAGVGHLFTRIDDHIRYVVLRLDPDRVAPLKDEAASKADLASGGKGN